MSTYVCYVSYDTQSPLISRGVARRASRRPGRHIVQSNLLSSPVPRGVARPVPRAAPADIVQSNSGPEMDQKWIRL